MKVKVYITNRSVFLDPLVIALVEVAAPPRVGEYMYLSNETRNYLEQCAIRRPGWKSAYADFVNPREPERVNLSKAIRVAAIAYREGDPYVSVELFFEN